MDVLRPVRRIIKGNPHGLKSDVCMSFKVHLGNLEFKAKIMPYSVRLKFSSRPDNESHMGNGQRLLHILKVFMIQ